MHVEKPSQGQNRVWLRYGDHELTFGEWHAAVIGFALGFIFGERGTAYSHIRDEPWYFLGTFAASYLFGRAVHIVAP